MSIKPPVAAAVWSSIVFHRFSSVNLPRLGHWQLCSVEGWIVGATTSGIWGSSDGSSSLSTSPLCGWFLQFIQLSGYGAQWNDQKHSGIHMLIDSALIFPPEHTFRYWKNWIYYEVLSCAACLAFWFFDTHIFRRFLSLFPAGFSAAQFPYYSTGFEWKESDA